VRTVSISAFVSVGILACFAAGCSTAQSRRADVAKTTNTASEVLGCGDIMSSVRRAVASAETSDAEARRIDGFPYLRISRFLAHIGKRFKDGASGPAFEAWVDRLRTKDAEAMRLEIANLSTGEMVALGKRIFGRAGNRESIFDAANECAQQQRTIELADPRRRQRLIEVAYVSDNYSELARSIGLFPLTSIPFTLGWEQWKKENLSTFRQPIADLAVKGRIVQYMPPKSDVVLKAAEVRALVERNRDPLLGIPEPKGRDLAQLIQSFAPIWQIDVAGHYDQIGHPTWHSDGTSIVVDRRKPTVFTRISHAVVGNQVLLQLNYSVWFQERPHDGPLDPLGGTLDGLIWRVTLAPDGRPLIYDSIHACGCYHLLFPLEPLRSKLHNVRRDGLKELPAILNVASMPALDQRVMLRLATASHYLVATSVVEQQGIEPEGRGYRFADDSSLRSLQMAHGGRRSLFRGDGIIAGTERLEGLVLWPSGINSPGAMRQWGHHATAFVDRRHFDDPDLFEGIFGRLELGDNVL
jgi:hypothetical protein